MISVITPVYNGQRFIESCIRVVIDQNCPAIEHIIVDGGSTDGTVDIIRRYASDYPHIRWVSEKDRGQSDAMNKGLAMARGEIIGFLNVDDYYEPDVLNRVARIFEGLSQPSLVVANCNVWDDAGKLLYVNAPKKLRFTDLLLGHRINAFPINPSAYFYHAALHDAIGPYQVDEDYVLDWDFILRAVRAAHVVYVNETWGNYRLLEGTKTVVTIRSGENTRRSERLLKSYRQRLPWWQRLGIALLSAAGNSWLWQNIKYFAERPEELGPSIRRRLLAIVGLT